MRELNDVLTGLFFGNGVDGGAQLEQGTPARRARPFGSDWWGGAAASGGARGCGATPEDGAAIGGALLDHQHGGVGARHLLIHGAFAPEKPDH